MIATSTVLAIYYTNGVVYTLHFYSVAVAMPGTLNRVSASLASYMAAWFLLQLHAWPDCETTAFLQKAFNLTDLLYSCHTAVGTGVMQGRVM